MSLKTQLIDYVRACFSGIWIESHEHQDALSEISQLCRDEQWQLASWDIEAGLQVGGSSDPESSVTDPLTAIRAATALGNADTPTILVLQNFHRFLASAEIVQAMCRQIVAGKQTRMIFVILAPIVQIPVELEKLFIVVEHSLPNREQLEEIARGVATEPGEIPDDIELGRALDASAGLTNVEAENAFSLSLVRHQHISASAVLTLKTQTLKNSGLLSLYEGTQDFESLGGMESLKAFARRALRNNGRTNSECRPRGVLLLSPPGCGKSEFAKALGKEVGRPVLILDVGSLMGSLVGQSEERCRKALQILDAMAPCVAMLDEIEKAFAGVNSNGDSGVASRMFGMFLTWLNDHSSDVFVVCTANDIGKLPPEVGRSERFDGVFFLDLPDRDEKDVVWDIYRDKFEIDRDQSLPDDTDWTGAEIKSCCRLSALLDVPLIQAAENVVPIAVTASESIERLRTWADGRCLSASQPGTYRYRGPRKTRRRVNRDPSTN